MMKRIKHTLLFCGIVLASNAHAFTDNEARKAILELRQQLNGMQQHAQEQQNQITELNDDLAKLRGQYEQSQKLLSEVKSEQQAGYASIDKRLTTLEPIPPEVLAQQDFDAAIAILQKGNYAAAAKAFDKHAKSHPNSAQTAEVLYYQAVSAYGMRNYKTAITRLTEFLNKHTNHEKTPDALLTLGSAQIESGKKTEGMTRLKQLIEQHPNTEAAKTAVGLMQAK